MMRVVQKHRSGELVPPDIAACHPFAADVKLTDHPSRDGFECFIEDEQSSVGDWLTNRGDLIFSARPAGRALKMRSDRKSTRLNSSHVKISYAVFCLKKKKK